MLDSKLKITGKHNKITTLNNLSFQSKTLFAFYHNPPSSALKPKKMAQPVLFFYLFSFFFLKQVK